MGMTDILLIDDERSFAELVKMNLELTGKYRVFLASNGKDGISIAKDIKPNIILLDITMPGMDGFEVLEALKKTSEDGIYTGCDAHCQK